MKSLGLASFVFFAVAIMVMLRIWPPDRTKTFSQNGARTSVSAVYYGAVMLIFLGLLSAFTYGWFIPALVLPGAYAVIFGIAVFGQSIAGLVPETTGLSVPVHRAGTGVMYFSTVPLVGILALSSKNPPVRALSGLACLFLAALIAVTLLNKRLREHAMVLQVIHLSVLAATIMLVTYTA